VSIGLNYYFGKYYQLKGNYSFNRLVTDTEDPIIPAFNTPENKYNIGISGRDIPRILGLKVPSFGFSINYKWVEGFIFEGSHQFTGFIPEYDLLDAQINFKIPKIHTTLKLGASNVLNNKIFQTYGGPRIGRMAYISATYDFVEK
jgi:outer membrane receptor protein involved in Fe transport